MTDKELIQVLRYCDSPEGKCADCPLLQQCRNSHGVKAAGLAADRLEALLAENAGWQEKVELLVENYYMGHNNWVDDSGNSFYRVTHWMEFPSPPSTEGVE